MKTSPHFGRYTTYVLFFLLCCRLIASYCIPLNDVTEARYAEIARLMLETGNWITPMHDYGVPFWAKPPLSIWASALSMQWFGMNAFAARLPALLFSIAILWFVGRLARKHSGAWVSAMSITALAGSVYFFLDAGAVMTDSALIFCTTLAMVAFWRGVINQQFVWGYIFFIAAGLGLLAKGPVAIVLMGMPLFVWLIWQRQWRRCWQRLPWVTGSLMTFAIATPWYYLAEQHTPGFLEYFIVGEHFHRFLDPGWHGDKYGFAHDAPYGMIWVYMLVGVIPWCIPGVVWLGYRIKTFPVLLRDNDGWIAYLVIWTFVPLLFFTFARNIIYPYVFPSLAPFALLFAELAYRGGLSITDQHRLLLSACIIGVIFLIGTGLFVFKPEWVEKSQRQIITEWEKQDPSADSHFVYWSSKMEFSARFYSHDRVKATIDPEKLKALLGNHEVNYLVCNVNECKSIPSEIQQRLVAVLTVPVLKERFTLYRVMCDS